MVQVEPIKPKLEPLRTKRWKLNCDLLLSTSAFKFNLRRYNLANKWKNQVFIPTSADKMTVMFYQWFGKHGRAVEVDPIKPKLKPPVTKRLKVNCVVLLPTSAFKFDLRRYSTGRCRGRHPRRVASTGTRSPPSSSTNQSSSTPGRQGPVNNQATLYSSLPRVDRCTQCRGVGVRLEI